MKNRWKVVAAIAAAVALVATPLASASATEGGYPPEICIPSDAIEAWTEVVPDIEHPAVYETVVVVEGKDAVAEIPEIFHFDYQRYSWTGGPLEGAPPHGAPGDGWTANTTNYEGAGHGTDPIGIAFDVSNEHSGNADWFFWTATKVIDQEYVPGEDAVEEVTEERLVSEAWTEIVDDIEHPAVDAVVCPPDEEEPTPLPALFAADPLPPTCEADGGLPTVEELQAVYPNVAVTFDREFDGPGTYTVTVTPDEGYAFVPANVVAPWSLNEDGSASRDITVTGALGFQDDDPQADCYIDPQVDPTEVALTLPVVNDECGTEDDFVRLPADVTGVDYEYASNDPEDFNVIATVAEGYVATGTDGWTDNGDGTFTRTVTLTDEACPTEPTNPDEPDAEDILTPTNPTDETPTLAATGGGDISPLLPIGAGALIAAGLALTFLRRAHRV